MVHQEVGRVDPRQFHVGFLRAGDTLMDRSSLSRDEESQKGIRQAREVLSDRGLLILDAHRTWMDIGFSAARLTEELSIENYVIPYAAYLRNRKFYRSLILNIGNQVDGVEMMPVIREEDKMSSSGLLGIRPRGIKFSKEQEISLNRKFFKRSLELINDNKPRTAIFLAPYASRKTYRGEVRTGVLGLLRKEISVLTTLSARDSAFKLDHTTFVSGELLRFDRNHSDDHINAVVDAQFEDLERRATIR